MLLVSEAGKNIAKLQLTVPWEDHLEDAHERKRTNDELVLVGLGITGMD